MLGVISEMFIATLQTNVSETSLSFLQSSRQGPVRYPERIAGRFRHHGYWKEINVILLEASYYVDNLGNWRLWQGSDGCTRELRDMAAATGSEGRRVLEAEREVRRALLVGGYLVVSRRRH